MQQGEHMIYIGTSGFSYEDWKGYYYPEHIAKKDMLPYYAQEFPAVEVDSTYYAIPGPATFVAMDRKTPKDFRFVVKAHKDMTHAEEPNPDAFDAFTKAIEPLRESGKLGCVLAQLPWSFKATPGNLERLRSIRYMLGTLPTVIEFRNAEWVGEETFALLRELDLGFCCVDEPRLHGLMPPVAAATSEIGYVRFHGRNAKQWWKHEQAYQRYDYLYSEDELREWVPKTREIMDQAADTYLFFNNHYQGKSAQNAKMFAQMLNLKLPGEVHYHGRQMTLDQDS